MLERPHSAANFGGEWVHLRRLAEALSAHGVEVVSSCDASLARRETFDLVHLWNIQHPLEALDFLQQLEGCDLPVALTPIYADLRRGKFAHRAQEVVGQFRGATLRAALRQLARRRLPVGGAYRFADLAVDDSLQQARKIVLQRTNALFPLTWSEADAVADQVGALPDLVQAIPVAADPLVSGERFRRAFGIRQPFLLIPSARIEPNKNQWLTLLALQDICLPIIVTGAFQDPGYEQLCRRDAPPRTQFVGVLEPTMLASAFAAAELCIHASAIECSSLSAMNGAAATGALVVGDTGSEAETFAGLARVVDPLDVDAIHRSVCQALAGGPAEQERREQLRLHVRRSFSWDASAETLAEGYQRLLPTRSPQLASPGQPPVHMRGIVLGPSGFAAEGREWLAALESAGHRPSLEGARLGNRESALTPDQQAAIATCAARPRHGDVVFHHMLPAHFEADRTASQNILHTVFEAETLPKDWVDRINRADSVLLHTEWNRQAFIRSGVEANKCVVLPPPMRTDAFAPRPNTEPHHPFRWLSVFDWQLRKGWDVLLATFGRTFRDDQAELWLKVFGDRSTEETQQFCEHYLRQHTDQPPRVRVFGGHWDQTRLQSLYHQADGFVLASRGEGWGRPVAEAMLSQLPVVASHGSALQTLLPNDNYGYPVTCHLQPVRDDAALETPCFAGLSWHEPDQEHLAAQLLAVMQDSAEAARRAERGRQHILNLCDQTRIQQQLSELIAAATRAPA